MIQLNQASTRQQVKEPSSGAGPSPLSPLLTKPTLTPILASTTMEWANSRSQSPKPRMLHTRSGQECPLQLQPHRQLPLLVILLLLVLLLPPLRLPPPHSKVSQSQLRPAMIMLSLVVELLEFQWQIGSLLRATASCLLRKELPPRLDGAEVGLMPDLFGRKLTSSIAYRPESGWLDGYNLTWFDIPGECNRIWNGGSPGVACTDLDQMAGCILGGGTAVNAGLWWKARFKP